MQIHWVWIYFHLPLIKIEPIKDYKEFRGKSPERDKLILNQIYVDGLDIDLVFESTADSLDAVNTLKAKLAPIKKVNTITVSKSKEIRIMPLEPIFEVGNVHILQGNWVEGWKKGIESFDGTGSTHDEMIDNLSSGYEYLVWKGKRPKTVRW